MKTIIETTANEITRIMRLKVIEWYFEIKNSASKFVAAGESLAIGIRDGIVNKAQEIIDAIVKAVRDAIAAAWAVIAPGSPSKVGFDMGQNLARGFAEGVLSFTPALQVAGAGMAQAAAYGSVGIGRSYGGYAENITRTETRQNMAMAAQTSTPMIQSQPRHIYNFHGPIYFSVDSGTTLQSLFDELRTLST